MNIKFYEGLRLDPEENKNIPANLDPYLPGKKLRKAVQLAQVLNKPLLLKGEPGSGKTRLAEAVAYELFGNDYEKYFFQWHVKSDGKAQDGLYMINHLKRLRDANLNKKADKEGHEIDLDITLPEGETKGNYLELGPLGKAFHLTNFMADALPPPVVLIDEIDKADIDFPNDLLLELDKMEFDIPESNDGNGKPIHIAAKKTKKPMIIITSNDEKPLPPAFLRRCLFHFISFPDIAILKNIVRAKFPLLDEALVDQSSNMFVRLRKAIETAGTATKNISTSELLDWVKLISYYKQHDDNVPDFSTVEYEEALAKDIETMQIFMKYNKEPRNAENPIG